MICNKPFCVMHEHWIILYRQMEHGQQQEEAEPSSSKKQWPAGGKKQRQTRGKSSGRQASRLELGVGKEGYFRLCGQH
jgi:hypothetical protein